MRRSSSTEAVVLRSYPVGDLHRGVTLLTPAGLIRPIAHGARSARGKLRGATELFTYGEWYLYTDPVKESVKITDVTILDHFVPLRESLSRFYIASLWAEVVIKSFGGGDDAEPFFRLFMAALRELAVSDVGRSERALIHFIWRYLELNGSQPDLDLCARTGLYLAEGEPIYYSVRDHGFLDATLASEEMVSWQPSSAAYLRETGRMPFAAALDAVPPEGGVARIKRVLYAILQDLVETPINTLRTGAGIL